jgi:DNA polymerase (family 10)
MEGEMAKETEFCLSLAEAEAALVAMTLLPACHKQKIVGSIRRKKASVHDIDIVVWPICEPVEVGQAGLFGAAETKLLPVKLLEILRVNGWWMRTPGDYPRKIELEPGEEYLMPMELYLTEPDGSNYGALVQMRTGSEVFNISLAERAKRMGLQYKAGYGIFRDGERLDDGTEEGIFKALGIDWCPPNVRDDDYRSVMIKGAKP